MKVYLVVRTTYGCRNEGYPEPLGIYKNKSFAEDIIELNKLIRKPRVCSCGDKDSHFFNIYELTVI